MTSWEATARSASIIVRRSRMSLKFEGRSERVSLINSFANVLNDSIVVVSFE